MMSKQLIPDAAIDREWRTARDIHSRVSCWDLHSIRKALANVTDDGSVEYRTLPHGNGLLKEYRLAEKVTA